jgi:hypothetical protein
MTRLSFRFNFYLAATAAFVLAGCSTTRDPSDNLTTLLRVHLESQPDQMVPPKAIAVYRENPLTISIESLYLISEDNVVSAKVVEEMGTYAIQIQFDQWAIPLLDHNSSSWQGRRIAIQAQWGPKHEHTRWLAAPKMNRHISDGTITFTPDASLEETRDIVIGLNNDARKVAKPLAW